MQKLKSIAKRIMACALFYSGVLKLLMLVKLRRKAVVLMYHRVLPKEMMSRTYSHSGITVDIETFEKHIRYLKKRFRIVTIEDFTEKTIRRVEFDPLTCLITFDDGWKDNYTHAYPILKKYNVPAIVFLPVNYISSDHVFWQERLTGILTEMVSMGKKSDDKYEKYSALLKKFGLQNILSLNGDNPRTAIAVEVSKKKTMTYSEIDQMITELVEGAGYIEKRTENGDALMNWHDVRQMNKDGISFGSHGMDHRIFTKIPESEAAYEIAESKRIMEGKVDEEISSISYPNGDYSNSIIKHVKSSGYRTAFGTEKGFVDVKDNPYALKRINIHNDVTNNIPMFMCVILGVF